MPRPKAVASGARQRLGGAAALVVLALSPGTSQAQSAADLSTRILIDGRTNDWTPFEAAFLNADVCPALLPLCGPDEEPSGDSVGSALQDLRQIRVTWDARNLYVAVEATLGGEALVVWLDFVPGGLLRASGLETWRAPLEFGPEMRPDAWLAVHDRQAVPELWTATGEESGVRVGASAFAAAASFDTDAGGRALEAALPWSVLFPAAPLAIDSEPGAPAAPVFVLPPEASDHGLRLAAVVVRAAAGLGAYDVAPNGSLAVPLDPRSVTVVDRAVRVEWDAARRGLPRFVDFGTAIQMQAAPRFVPSGPAAVAPAPVQITNLRTLANGARSRLLVADAGLDLSFAFDVTPETPQPLYVSASVYSLRGERVRVLYRDALRPAGARGDPGLDRWDGRNDAGHAAPGGLYVLRLTAGTAPGLETSALSTSLTVVR